MASIVLPKGFMYVVAATFSPVWLLVWQSIRVGRARRVAKIDYPQRAHQNTLEYLPVTVISTLVTGLKYPIVAASLCGVWTLGRVLYTLGYATGDPSKRGQRGGFLGSLSMVALIASGTWTVGQFLWAEL